jgi:hypothetical protein
MLDEFAHPMDDLMRNWARWLNTGNDGSTCQTCASAERMYDGGWADEEAQNEKATATRASVNVTHAVYIQDALQAVPIGDRQLLTLWYCGRWKPSRLCVAFGIRYSQKLLTMYLNRALNRTQAQYKFLLNSEAKAKIVYKQHARVLRGYRISA